LNAVKPVALPPAIKKAESYKERASRTLHRSK
jgi:hypothetical protein